MRNPQDLLGCFATPANISQTDQAEFRRIWELKICRHRFQLTLHICLCNEERHGGEEGGRPESYEARSAKEFLFREERDELSYGGPRLS